MFITAINCQQSSRLYASLEISVSVSGFFSCNIEDTILREGPVASLPRVMANYSGGFGHLQQVLVLQELPAGNACNGGPLHILAIAADKKPLVADPIEYCGGPGPLISRKGKTLLITLPGRSPNRPIPGSTVWIPTEKWSYEEGLLTRIK